MANKKKNAGLLQITDSCKRSHFTCREVDWVQLRIRTGSIRGISLSLRGTGPVTQRPSLRGSRLSFRYMKIFHKFTQAQDCP